MTGCVMIIISLHILTFYDRLWLEIIHDTTSYNRVWHYINVTRFNSHGNKLWNDFQLTTHVMSLMLLDVNYHDTLWRVRESGSTWLCQCYDTGVKETFQSLVPFVSTVLGFLMHDARPSVSNWERWELVILPESLRNDYCDESSL